MPFSPFIVFLLFFAITFAENPHRFVIRNGTFRIVQFTGWSFLFFENSKTTKKQPRPDLHFCYDDEDANTTKLMTNILSIEDPTL